MRYRHLSHVLTEEIPVYGGRSSIGLSKVKSVAKGDSANISQFTITNHFGTHVEGPNHFFESGRKIADYSPDTWIFKHPQVVNVKLEPSEVLASAGWIGTIKSDADILLFQSGWSALRGKDSYCTENPGLSPEIGTVLRKNYPKIRALAIDWISISPFQDRPLGRASHKALLDPKGENEPILIIEDADLSGDLKDLSEIYVIPLRIYNADAAPCTIIGVFND